MPNQPKTKNSTFRIPPELMQEAKARAEERGETVTDVVIRALEVDGALLWAERLRADAAERELRRATRVLARLAQMAEAWNKIDGPTGLAGESVLMTIRETP